MTLQECSKSQGEITLLYDDEDELWYWEINGGGDGQIGSAKGFINPNSAKISLIEFLKDWKGFYEGFPRN